MKSVKILRKQKLKLQIQFKDFEKEKLKEFLKNEKN